MINKGLCNLMTKKTIIATKIHYVGIQVDYGVVELIGKFYYLIEFHNTYHEKLSKSKEKSIQILKDKGYEIFYLDNQVEFANWISEECLC